MTSSRKSFDRAAEQLLVGAGAHAVELGGVEERDAELEGSSDRGDALVVVAGAVGHRHAHRAEAEGGDFEAFFAEGALLHGWFP